MQISAAELAHLLGGKVEGDPEVTVNRPSKIEEGQEGTISFLSNLKYEHFAYTSNASILLVSNDFEPKQPIASTLIRVPNVYESVAFLLEKFNQFKGPEEGISKQAFIHARTQIGEDVTIGHFAVIEEGAIIGNNVTIYPQVYIGPDVHIQENTSIHPGVRIYKDCKIGKNCTIHSNTVIGSDGFGFAPQDDGTYKKVAQIGNVVIEDDVEVGANTCIDRATMGSTVIKKGVKLDNLVQLAHNVEIGANTVMAAQSGVAGSTKIGANCQIGGQAGFVGHIKIADHVKVQAQSGISRPISKDHSAVYGSPALNYRDYLKSYAVFRQLPELAAKINTLEKMLEELNAQK